jgi:hypothetical protein
MARHNGCLWSALPADAPELNPDEGFWRQPAGVEWGHLGGLDLPHLRGELRHAVPHVRRQPRMRKGYFLGAALAVLTSR